MRKLRLNAQTIRVLTGADLELLRGGVITVETNQCDTWTGPDPSGNTCQCGPVPTSGCGGGTGPWDSVGADCTFYCPSVVVCP